MTEAALTYTRRKRLRHAIHYRWNRSRFNRNFEPWVSSCICCCIWCEDEEER